MATHLTAVKTAAPAPPHAFWAWCETCHRDVGPPFDEAGTPEKLAKLHESYPTESDYALMDRLTAGSGRTDA